MKNCHFKLIFSCHNRKRGLRREGNNARMLIIFLPCYNNWISIAISASKHLSLYIIVLYKIHSYSQFVKWACIMWKNDLILVLLKEIESQWSIHKIIVQIESPQRFYHKKICYIFKSLPIQLKNSFFRRSSELIF